MGLRSSRSHLSLFATVALTLLTANPAHSGVFDYWHEVTLSIGDLIGSDDDDWDDQLCGGYCVQTYQFSLRVGPAGRCSSCYCDTCYWMCTACTQFGGSFCTSPDGTLVPIDTCTLDLCDPGWFPQ